MAIKVKHEGNVTSRIVASAVGGTGRRNAEDSKALAQKAAQENMAANRQLQGAHANPTAPYAPAAQLGHASLQQAPAVRQSALDYERLLERDEKQNKFAMDRDRNAIQARGTVEEALLDRRHNYAVADAEAEAARRQTEWESRYSFGQRERISEINEAIDAVQNDDSLSEAQKQDALRQLKGKLYGIKPLETPPEEPPKIPEPVFHGENNELMWDPAKGTWIANPALGAKGGKGGADAGKPKYTAKDINDAAKELMITDPDTGETKGPDLSTPEGQQAVIQYIRQREAIMAQLNGEEVNLPGRTNAQGVEVPASVPIGAEQWATGVNRAQGAQGNASGAQGVPVFDGTKANVEMGRTEASKHDDFLLSQIPKGPESRAFVENWIKNYEQAISQEKDPKNRGMWEHQLEVLKGKLGEFGEKSGESAPAANKAPKANPVVTESISDDDVFKGMPEEPKQRKKWLRKEIYEERKYLRSLSRGDANLRAVTEERIKRLENKLDEDGE